MSETSETRIHRVKVGLTFATLALFALLGVLMVYGLDATGQFNGTAGVGFIAGMMTTLGGLGLMLFTHEWYHGELDA